MGELKKMSTDWCFRFPELASAEIARLTAEVERLTMKNAALDGSVRHHNNRAETAEAQLAELRARVRPGVEEIEKILHEIHLGPPPGETRPCWTVQGQAIHAILPPVPKVLSVEELEDITSETLRDGYDFDTAIANIHKAIYRGEE